MWKELIDYLCKSISGSIFARSRTKTSSAPWSSPHLPTMGPLTDVAPAQALTGALPRIPTPHWTLANVTKRWHPPPTRLLLQKLLVQHHLLASQVPHWQPSHLHWKMQVWKRKNHGKNIVAIREIFHSFLNSSCSELPDSRTIDSSSFVDRSHCGHSDHWQLEVDNKWRLVSERIPLLQLGHHCRRWLHCRRRSCFHVHRWHVEISDRCC